MLIKGIFNLFNYTNFKKKKKRLLYLKIVFLFSKFYKTRQF